MTPPSAKLSATATLGEFVRGMRQTKNWSQGELAKRAGVGRRTVVRLETGEDSRTSLESIASIARALSLHEALLVQFQRRTVAGAFRRMPIAAPDVIDVAQSVHHQQETIDMGSMQSAILESAKSSQLAAFENVITNPRLEPLRGMLSALRTREDGLLLVVCPRPSELSDAVRQSDRVVVWAEPESRGGGRRIPSSVVAIVIVQYPGHKGTRHLEHEAKRVGAQFRFQTITPRTVHELCEAAGLIPSRDDNPDDDEIPMPKTHRLPLHGKTTSVQEDTRDTPDEHVSASSTSYVDERTGKTRRGAIKMFLDEHANFDPDVVGEEVKRLTKIANGMGMPTTELSLAQAFRLARNERKGKTKPQTNGSATALADTSRATHVEPASPAPAATLAVTAQGSDEAGRMAKDWNALTSLVDDAHTALSLIRDTLRDCTPLISEALTARHEADELRAKLALMQRTFSTLFEAQTSEIDGRATQQ